MKIIRKHWNLPERSVIGTLTGGSYERDAYFIMASRKEITQALTKTFCSECAGQIKTDLLITDESMNVYCSQECANKRISKEYSTKYLTNERN